MINVQLIELETFYNILYFVAGLMLFKGVYKFRTFLNRRHQRLSDEIDSVSDKFYSLQQSLNSVKKELDLMKKKISKLT